MVRRTIAWSFLFLLQASAARAASVLFSANFDDGKLASPLVVGSYIMEENGSFADTTELDASVKDGQLAISGTGNTDIIVVEGHYVGWFGKSVYAPIGPTGDGIITAEADVEVKTGVLSNGGSDSGYMAGLTVESTESDRILFFILNANSSHGMVATVAVDEADAFDSTAVPFKFTLGHAYRLRLEFDSSTQMARGLVDGHVVLERPYHGQTQFTRAGAMATVRTRDDKLDARFDNLAISFQKLAHDAGARRTIAFRMDGDVATADVRIDIAVSPGPYTMTERFDPGWTVSDISDGGVYSDALVWKDVPGPTLSYRLSRSDAYFSKAAAISGLLEVGDLGYTIGGDGAMGGAVTPFVAEVLATPSFRIGNGLDGCTVKPANVEGAWIGNCLGLTDANITPAEGFQFRPSFGTQWSQAAGLDPGLTAEAQRRFWSKPGDPAGSEAVLAKVEADGQGLFDWQGGGAFGANIDDTMCAAYFYVTNPAAAARVAYVGMGSDDSSAIRVNGEPVAAIIGCGGPACFDGKHRFSLQPGKNLVAFYTFERAGGYNACIRFEDQDGAPVPVRTTLDPTGYAADTPPPAKDCNGNCVPDSEDISSGTSKDDDGNGIPDECQPVVVDCNRNGKPDADDIASGASKDSNGDGIPDECQDAFSLEPVSPYCVALRLTTTRITRGGEIGLAYDSTKVIPLCPTPGPDFPGTADDLVCGLQAAASCALPDGTDRGFTVGWFYGGTGQQLPPGSYKLLDLCFLPVPGALPADPGAAAKVCSPLRFTRCLGLETAPVQNVVTGAKDETVPLFTLDGQVCGEEKPFRRGDVNGDGQFDISDVVSILGCLFLGDSCTSCWDAADANDDGRVTISDPIFLLQWRYLGGPQPPEPHPACGHDPTDDKLVG